MAWGWDDYGDYVSADDKRRRAQAAARQLETKGRKLAPVQPAGRAIAASFWGKAWCQNLEGYSDYASRLPRGRSYLRQGAVLDLQVSRGAIKAVVSGTRLYEVSIEIDTLAKADWTRLKKECAGKVGSLMELLQGKLSAPVMEIVTRKGTGLFPKPGEIHLECSCPDWADLCKHVAAVLYGVGARLDESPELLFVLRGIDHLELIASATRSLTADRVAPATDQAATRAEGSLTEIFGIEIDAGTVPAVSSKPPQAGKKARATAKPVQVPSRPHKPAAAAPASRTAASPRARRSGRKAAKPPKARTASVPRATKGKSGRKKTS